MGTKTAGGVPRLGDFGVRESDEVSSTSEFLIAGKATMAASTVKKHRFRKGMDVLLTGHHDLPDLRSHRNYSQ